MTCRRQVTEALHEFSRSLNPTVKAKIPRSKVYQIIALTNFTGACGCAGTAYWGRLRKQIA